MGTAVASASYLKPIATPFPHSACIATCTMTTMAAHGHLLSLASWSSRPRWQQMGSRRPAQCLCLPGAGAAQRVASAQAAAMGASELGILTKGRPVSRPHSGDRRPRHTAPRHGQTWTRGGPGSDGTRGFRCWRQRPHTQGRGALSSHRLERAWGINELWGCQGVAEVP